MPGIHFREVVCMLGIFGLFLQAAAGHILYLALHLESGSFPRPLPPDRERAAFADLQKGGAGAAQARDMLIRHNLRLVAHIVKKYYALPGDQEDLVSIGTIGLMKAVDTFDATRKARFSTYASRCIENEIRMQFRRERKNGQTVSLQEALEADGDSALTLADVIQDGFCMEDSCERQEDVRLRQLLDTLPARERQILLLRYGLAGQPPLTQLETAGLLGISRSYVSRLETHALELLRQAWGKNG
jgi:RNA polymerase sigma factor (sigma-70 family)